MIYGLSIFNVDKDLDITLLDIESVNLKRIEIDESYYQLLDYAEDEFDKLIGTYEKFKDLAFNLGDKLILARLYMSKNKVLNVLFITTKCCSLRILVKRLERLGWNRILMFEIRKIIKSVKRINY